MCTTIMYKCKEKTCKHTWMEIDTPCGPNKGFSNCNHFHHNHAPITFGRARPKRREGKKEDCPWHGLKGAYDFNYIRMVEKEKLKFWGFPPKPEGTLRFLVMLFP